MTTDRVGWNIILKLNHSKESQHYKKEDLKGIQGFRVSSISKAIKSQSKKDWRIMNYHKDMEYWFYKKPAEVI